MSSIQHTMIRKKEQILSNIFGSFDNVGDEYLFVCPNKKCKSRKKKKKKMSINIERDVYKCWVCNLKGPSIYSLIKKYGSVSDRAEWTEHKGMLDKEILFDKLLHGEKKREEARELNLPEEFRSLSKKIDDWRYKKAKTYLESRGITPRDMLYWKIGYCPTGKYGARVIVPSFDDEGILTYFVARSYAEEILPKYRNPKASKNIIFNDLMVDWGQDIVIVEGVFDAIKAGQNAIPILGSSFDTEHKLFEKIIEKGVSVYVCLDPDARKKQEKILRLLRSYSVPVYDIPLTGEKDVGDMTKEEFQKHKRSAVKFNPRRNLLKQMEIRQ